MGGEEEGHEWKEEDSGDWVEGTGISNRAGARAEEVEVAAAGVVPVAGAETDVIEAVVEVEAMDATAERVAGSEPEVAAA